MVASRRLAAALLATALVTACGSTVSLKRGAVAPDGSSGLTSPGTTTDVPSSAPSGEQGVTVGSSSGGSTGPGTTGQSPAVTSDVPTDTTTGTSVTPTAPGAKALPRIRIGSLTATGASKYQSSLGFKGATGDQVAITQSMVSYLNAHGGLGGRQIQLVPYDLDTASFAADASSAVQAACTYFTQDNHVTAVASIVALLPDSFYACMQKAHVPVVLADEGVSTDFFKRFADTVYMPSGPTYTRLLDDSVDALWNAGWLTAKSKVGIVGYDTADVHSAVDKGLVPALARRGLKLTTGLYTGTTTAAASEYNGGVLSFEAKGVDRVFFAPGGQPIYFALAAEQQAYHPYYEMGSLEYPTVVAANLPADQLVGSMGVDWLPYLDLPADKRSTNTTPGIVACKKAVASANPDYTGQTTLELATWVCDDWNFLRDVFAAGAVPNASSIRKVAESLGTSFKPASTFSSTFGVGRPHDGTSSYRLIAFQKACSCYAYTSGVRPLL